MEKREKLEMIVEKGKERVARVVEEIEREYKERKDYIVKYGGIDFEVSEDIGVVLKHPGEERRYGLTEWSKGQLLGLVGIPRRFADRLIELEEREYLEEGLRRLFMKVREEGVLVRVVGERIKGILSVHYRRMDGGVFISDFVSESIKAGYVPYTADNTDYRYRVVFLSPRVEEIDTDAYVFTIGVTTSDYGARALEVEMGVMRIVCENLAIGYDLLRKVHLGRRFVVEGEYLELSERTYRLDEMTMVSAMRDLVSESLRKQNEIREIIRSAYQRKVEGNVWERIKKKFGEEVMKKGQVLWESNIEELPSGENYWRLGNVLSLIANSEEKSDRRLDLQKEAFEIMI